MFPSIFIRNVNLSHQETENLYLEVFFNTQFNRSGNPNASIEDFSRFGSPYTVELTAHSCNVKKHQPLFTDYLIN